MKETDIKESQDKFMNQYNNVVNNAKSINKLREE